MMDTQAKPTPQSEAANFDQLDDESVLSASELGQLWKRCKVSIQRAARRGEIPPPIQLLGKQVWVVGAIRKHLVQRQESALQKQLGIARRMGAKHG